MAIQSTASTESHQPNGTTGPKFTLYTAFGCPYAARVHIVLHELKIPYERVEIDLAKPREDWYLKINPRGLVPALSYTPPQTSASTILTESTIISQFLADLHPSPFLPATSQSPTAALTRARIAFFIDAWSTKINTKITDAVGLLVAPGDDDEEEGEGAEKKGEARAKLVAKSRELGKAIEKEIEPLLADAAPFVGGSGELTFAEAIVAPFLLRLHSWARQGILHDTLDSELSQLPHYSAWKEAVTTHASVLGEWDEERIMTALKQLFERMRVGKREAKRAEKEKERVEKEGKEKVEGGK